MGDLGLRTGIFVGRHVEPPVFLPSRARRSFRFPDQLGRFAFRIPLVSFPERTEVCPVDDFVTNRVTVLKAHSIESDYRAIAYRG